jgi:transposase InsO family protein
MAMCRLYGVTRAGYYAWRQRGPSQRTHANEQLWKKIQRIHARSRNTYGSPRVHEALKASGDRVSKGRVERLMRKNALKARVARLYRSNPAHHAFYASIPNSQLEKIATAPDQVWVGDVTYLKVGTVWRYLAVVMDKYSRRVIGWSLGKARDANLTIAALNRAVFNRRKASGVIFHTDRGIEYAAYAFRRRLGQLGFMQSMNRPGTMIDNAHVESFFHSMKSDTIHGKTFRDDREIQKEIRSYMPFYNHERLHSSLGFLPPAKYEERAA